MQPTFYVWAKWDDEAEVWYTAETSIRGLVTEADTLEELRERLAADHSGFPGGSDAGACDPAHHCRSR